MAFQQLPGGFVVVRSNHHQPPFILGNQQPQLPFGGMFVVGHRQQQFPSPPQGFGFLQPQINNVPQQRHIVAVINQPSQRLQPVVNQPRNTPTQCRYNTSCHDINCRLAHAKNYRFLQCKRACGGAIQRFERDSARCCWRCTHCHRSFKQ